MQRKNLLLRQSKLKKAVLFDKLRFEVANEILFDIELKVNELSEVQTTVTGILSQDRRLEIQK